VVKFLGAWGGVVVLCIAMLIAAAPPAQAALYAPDFEWRMKSPGQAPLARFAANMAYDPARGEMVLFGGATSSGGSFNNETWTWDGATWTKKNPDQSPPARFAAMMAFDPSSGEIVLAGGRTSSSYFKDTWTWDGENWTQRQDMPEPRAAAGMAWDSDNGRLILFGGDAAPADTRNQTWAWQGGTWSELNPAASPSARIRVVMTNDPARGEIVLYGGDSASNQALGDTWTWDGKTWVQESPEVSPPPLSASGIVFHSGLGRVVLFGGYPASGWSDETWSWDGSNWRPESSSDSPGGRANVSMAFDPRRGEIVMFGGYGFIAYGDTWTYGPTEGISGNWALQSPSTSPSGRGGAGMAYDEARGEVVMFGGEIASNNSVADTWIWDEGEWIQMNPSDAPSARSSPAMAFDHKTGKVVLFGGVGTGGVYRDDTWTWDGEQWHEETPAHKPSARSHADMVFDYRTGKLTLFGGVNNGVRDESVWVWDGEDWTEVTSSPGPVGRNAANLVFDARAGRVMLFGGYDDESDRRNDTWLWDGAAWTELSPSNTPPARSHAAMEFFPATGDTILFGGVEGFDATGTNSTWIWDGGSWLPAEPRISPSPRYSANMVFNPAQGELLLFGGVSNVTRLNDTWSYGLEVDPPKAEILAPAGGGVYTVGQEVLTMFSCEGSIGDPVIVSCKDSNGADAPSGSLDTSSVGEKTYAVIAASQKGPTGSAEITYEVVKATPSILVAGSTNVTLGSPISTQAELIGGYNPVGELTFAVYGPGDESCSGVPAFESGPVIVSGNGIVTSPDFTPTVAGAYRWVVSYSGDPKNEAIASNCDSSGALSVVAAPPVVDVDPEQPPVCPAFQARSAVKRGVAQPPFGKGSKADGFLVRVKTGFDATAEIRARVRYRVGGRKRVARLGAFTVRVNGERLVRLAAPAKMRRHFKRSGQRLRGAKAKVVFTARVKPHGAPARCFQRAPRRTVPLKVTGVSGRAVLRSAR
jgi:hypothetical protein